MEHQGVHKNSLKRVCAFQIEVEFEGRGKLKYPEKNLAEQGREPTTNSTHIWRRGQDPGPHWWEASALTTVPPLTIIHSKKESFIVVPFVFF